MGIKVKIKEIDDKRKWVFLAIFIPEVDVTSLVIVLFFKVEKYSTLIVIYLPYSYTNGRC